MLGLTRKQIELYEWLKRRDENLPGPSYSEMAAALGLKSKSGVHRLVLGLEERGAIFRQANRARTIRVRS